MGSFSSCEPRQKQGEEHLRRVDEFAQRVYNSSLSGLYVYDLKQRQNIFINKQYTKLTGYSFEDIIAMEPRQFFALFHPDDRQRLAEHVERMERADDHVSEVEYRFKTKDGRWIWCLSQDTVFARDEDGLVTQFIGTFLDITDRKAAEQRIEAENREIALVNRILRVFTEKSGDDLFDKVLDIVLEGLASRHGVFGYIAEPGHLICPSLTKMLDQCEVANKCIHYPPQKWKGLWARTLREKRSLYTNESSPVPKGHPAINNNLATPILFRGKAIGLLNLANKETDYTERDRGLLEAMAERIAPLLYAWIQKKLREDERVKAEEELRHARDELEERVKERTAALELLAEQLRRVTMQLAVAEQNERQRIAQILHDDLQQLLVGAKIQLEFLSGNVERDKRRRLEDSIRMITESLKMSRSLTDELAPKALEYENMSQVLEWLCDFMQNTYNLNVELRVEDQIEVPSKDTRSFLKQSVRELLFNVVKHSGTDVAQVQLNKDGDGNLRITVRDQGKGFDPALLCQEHSRQTHFGLFSLQQRLSILKGALKLDSVPGNGTTCTITLPLLEEEAVEEVKETVPFEKPARKSRTDEENDIRVLVVDDHEVVREAFVGLFEKEPDITIIGQADNGKKGVEMAFKLIPDVILMDINMPLMDGIEATRTINRVLPNIRIIGLSIDDSKATVEAMQTAGASDFLGKESSSQEVLATIRKHGRLSAGLNKTDRIGAT